MEASKLCYEWLTSRRSVLHIWGIHDGWQVSQAYEACIAYHRNLGGAELDVSTWLRDRILHSWALSNILYWVGLRGSDDFGWAAVLNLNCFLEFTEKAFIDREYKWIVCSRGALQFLNEIQSHYVADDGHVYWNYDKTYSASISNSLYIRLCLMINSVEPNAQLVEQAKTTCHWLLYVSGLWDTDGGIMDGIRDDGSTDRTKWTYNQAVILKGLFDLYTVTNDLTYFVSAVKIANFTLNNLIDHSNGILCEVANGAPKLYLSQDQKQFKGIFIRYLTQFAIEGKNQLTESQFKRFTDFVKHNSDFLWANGRNHSLQSFSPFWHKQDNHDDAESNVVSLVAAFDLFNSSAKLAQSV